MSIVKPRDFNEDPIVYINIMGDITNILEKKIQYSNFQEFFHETIQKYKALCQIKTAGIYKNLYYFLKLFSFATLYKIICIWNKICLYLSII